MWSAMSVKPIKIKIYTSSCILLGCRDSIINHWCGCAVLCWWCWL